MSVLKTLTEGIVERDLAQEGKALLSKWERTGLLEGLTSDYQRQSMSRLLENQAKQLLKEASSMAAGDVEGFSAVAFPIVRRVFGGLVANDIVSVEPMSLPSGLIFFMDFTYTNSRLGETAGRSIYGTDKVAKGIRDGVNIIDSTYTTNNGGPYLMGGTYASPTASCRVTSSAVSAIDYIDLDAITDAEAKKIRFDPDLSGSTSLNLWEIALTRADLEVFGETTDDLLDYDNLPAFTMTGDQLAEFVSGGVDAIVDIASGNTKQIRRLTQQTSTLLKLYFVSELGWGANLAIKTGVEKQGNLVAPVKDDFDIGGAIGSVVGGDPWGLEGAGSAAGTFDGRARDLIPEIDIKVDSVAVTAQTKKLKAKWSPELGQDLNAYHNLDAEVELTSILSEQIALEIDRELLNDLVNGATAATRYWSRSPGLFVDRTTGAEVGANTAAPDFTGTVSEWYETLVETINDVSAEIHTKTLRGGANFIVCSPQVANILEFTSGFRASVTADVAKGDIGAVKTGNLSKKFDVYVDPYFLKNVILVGRKGSSFLESGYVYAPYVPLQVTPTIFGVEDFVPRKGVMTRYAKKMVRPDMYGLVVCRGLNGESGA